MEISAHPNGYRAVTSIKEGCKFFPYFLLQTKFIFARNESSPDRRRDGFFAPFWDTLKYRVIQLSDQERSTIWYAFHGIHVRRGGDGNKIVYFSSWLKIRVSFIVIPFFCIGIWVELKNLRLFFVLAKSLFEVSNTIYYQWVERVHWLVLCGENQM